MNRLNLDSEASAMKEATPPIWTPSIRSSFLISMTFMLISQAVSFTPRSWACLSSWGSGVTLWAFIIFLNIQRPMPPKLNLEGPRRSMPPRFITPSMRPMRPLPVRFPFWMAFRPQKVKNMETCMSKAAAPVAMMKAPMTLSMSPLMTTMLAFSTGCASLIFISSSGFVSTISSRPGTGPPAGRRRGRTC